MRNLRGYAEALESICETGTLGKKAVQKLMYLMERKGADLNLGYSIHFFGPYSSKLDDILHVLESDEVICINTSGRTHTVSILDSSKSEGNGLSEKDKQIVAYVIDKFGDKSAFELEGIATLDYVACHLSNDDIKDDKNIINGVKRIKGTKYRDDQLNQYLAMLKSCDYLS